MQKVAFFLGYGWLGVSTPPLSCAMYLAKHGYIVDIYSIFDTYCDSLSICKPNLDHPNINYFFSDVVSTDNSIVSVADNIIIPQNYWNLVRLARQNIQNYAWVVGFDPVGLFCAAAYAQDKKIPYIYHSLEIEDDTYPLKQLEKICQRRSLFTITQDKARAEIISKLNEEEINKIVVLPNSSTGNVLSDKDEYFRSMFSEIGNRHIVLACGTLLPNQCIDQIVVASRQWADDFILILNGWIPDPSFKQAVEHEIKNRKNIFLVENLLPPEQKFRVFQSSDICLVFFNPINPNLKYAAGSAGKIYDSMRCGVPIIGNDIPGMSELLVSNGCGVVVKNAQNIKQILPVVIKNYEVFRKNCFKTFPKYEFGQAYQYLLKKYNL